MRDVRWVVNDQKKFQVAHFRENTRLKDLESTVLRHLLEVNLVGPFLLETHGHITCIAIRSTSN
jgi:hypothetical protein